MNLENTCIFCPPRGDDDLVTGLVMSWRGKAGLTVTVCYPCIQEMLDEFRAATIPVSRDTQEALAASA